MVKRTTLILDEELIKEAMEAAGTRTRTETVELALRELMRKCSREAFRQELGTFTSIMSGDELRELRYADWSPLPDR